MMHTYRKFRDGNEAYYEVGVLMPTHGGGYEWWMLSRHKTEDQAMSRVNALNGGTGQPYLYQG